MTSLRLRVRFGLLAVWTVIAMAFVVESGRAQGFRGISGMHDPRMPGPGFTGIHGGFGGNPSGISGGIGGNPTGISGGFSGFPRHFEPPKLITVWKCRRCGNEVARGDFPPKGPCPFCSNNGVANNPGGWNRPPVGVPPQNQPVYPPGNQSQPPPENTGIQPSPGGFFASSQGTEDPTDISVPDPSNAYSFPGSTSPDQPGATRSNRGTVIAVMVVLLLLVGIAAGVLVMINHSSKKNRYEYRSGSRRRGESAPPRRRYRD